jgi:hypothetical protein
MGRWQLTLPGHPTLVTQRALLRNTGAARETQRRSGRFTHEHDAPVAAEMNFGFDVSAEHQRSVFERGALARVHRSALQNRDAADRQQREQQLGNRRCRCDGARRRARKTFAKGVFVRDGFGAPCDAGTLPSCASFRSS